MNKRDKAKLDALLLRLTAEFSDRHRQSTVIWRGEVRAIVAAIRAIKTDGADSATGKGHDTHRSEG